jgi:hypothetical protein
MITHFETMAFSFKVEPDQANQFDNCSGRRPSNIWV